MKGRGASSPSRPRSPSRVSCRPARWRGGRGVSTRSARRCVARPSPRRAPRGARGRAWPPPSGATSGPARRAVWVDARKVPFEKAGKRKASTSRRGDGQRRRAAGTLGRDVPGSHPDERARASTAQLHRVPHTILGASAPPARHHRLAEVTSPFDAHRSPSTLVPNPPRRISFTRSAPPPGG